MFYRCLRKSKPTIGVAIISGIFFFTTACGDKISGTGELPNPAVEPLAHSNPESDLSLTANSCPFTDHYTAKASMLISYIKWMNIYSGQCEDAAKVWVHDYLVPSMCEQIRAGNPRYRDCRYFHQLPITDQVVVVALTELNFRMLCGSANVSPPPTYFPYRSSFDAWLATKQTRGVTINNSFQASCEEGNRIVAYQVSGGRHWPGWTPMLSGMAPAVADRIIGAGARSYLESWLDWGWSFFGINFFNLMHPAEGSAIYYGHKPNDACYEQVVIGVGRLTMPMSWVPQTSFALQVPWISGELTTKICCAGKGKANVTYSFRGSHFPSHVSYIDKNSGLNTNARGYVEKFDMVGQRDQTDLKGFMLTPTETRKTGGLAGFPAPFDSLQVVASVVSVPPRTKTVQIKPHSTSTSPCVTPTATPRPTATPTPTATPRRTATPTPTATPRPTTTAPGN